MKVKRQVVVGVSWTWWDDGTIEVDAYRMDTGRRSFPVAHVEGVDLPSEELDQLEALVLDQVHMHNKRALRHEQVLLF